MNKENLAEEEIKKKNKKGNIMREVKIEKVILNIGAKEEELEKAVKLLKIISNSKPIKVKAKRRIQTLGISPGKEIACMVTLRGKKAVEILGRLLKAVKNKLKKKQIKENHFSFGIEEYIEIPGMSYDREIGIRGLDVTACFARAGKRVKRRKIKRGKIPKKQAVTVEEIIKFLQDNFNTKIIERGERE